MAKEILIVEDDRKLAQACGRALEEQGYSVSEAHDGVTAMDAVAVARPALILLDLLLPRRDGRSVLTKLAREPQTSSIPVVVMSGVFKGKGTERELLDAGARGFLEKPFTPDQLVSLVHSLIGDALEDEAQPDWSRARLEDVAAPEFLWRVMSQGKSGALHFQRGKLHKVLLLERGKPVAIRSNAAAETLGRFLLARRKIDKAAYNALQKRIEKGERQGEALQRMNLLPEAELETEVRAQAAAKLLELFSWTEGEAWLQEGVRKLGYASPLQGWSPERALLRGAKYYPFERIMALLAPFASFGVEAGDVTLHEREQKTGSVVKLYEALRPPVAVGNLIADHAAALYALWLVGALRFTMPAKLPDPDTSPSLRSIPIPDAGKTAELQTALSHMRAQTYFELFGISPDAEPSGVQAAYLKLAKRYHPDRFVSEPMAVKTIASEIFNHIATARDTLEDPSRRDAYLQELQGGGERDRVSQVLEAEKLCREGEGLLKRRDYEAALRCFERACELDPDEGEFHALRGWAHFVVHRKTPGGPREAVGQLERAISLAPESPKGYYYLAQLYKASDEPAKAEKLLGKVLDLDPKHVEAQQVLRVLKMRKSKEDKRGTGSGGLFGLGSLGRKKS